MNKESAQGRPGYKNTKGMKWLLIRSDAGRGSSLVEGGKGSDISRFSATGRR